MGGVLRLLPAPPGPGRGYRSLTEFGGARARPAACLVCLVGFSPSSPPPLRPPLGGEGGLAAYSGSRGRRPLAPRLGCLRFLPSGVPIIAPM